MNKTLIIEKLNRIFYECDRHLLRVDQAYRELSTIMPLDETRYQSLSDDEIKTLDQFLFRFAKLQDAMGQKLFKSMLLFLGEEIEGVPFIDILNIMEKLSLLESANEWKVLREDRNELAHNYDDEAESMSLAINQIYNKKVLLENIYNNIKIYYTRKL